MNALNCHSHLHNGHRIRTATDLSIMCNILTTQNIVQGRLWLLHLVRLRRDSFLKDLLPLRDVLQRPRTMRWYHAFQTSSVQIPAFQTSSVQIPAFQTSCVQIPAFQTSPVQTPGCHSAPPDCPSRTTLHPPIPEVHIWSLTIDQYQKDKKYSSKCIHFQVTLSVFYATDCFIWIAPKIIRHKYTVDNDKMHPNFQKGEKKQRASPHQVLSSSLLALCLQEM